MKKSLLNVAIVLVAAFVMNWLADVYQMLAPSDYAPLVYASCEEDDGELRPVIHVDKDGLSSYGWLYAEKLVNPVQGFSHSQEPGLSVRTAFYPDVDQYGWYSITTRYIEDNTVDAFPEHSKILNIQLLYVPDCSK